MRKTHPLVHPLFSSMALRLAMVALGLTAFLGKAQGANNGMQAQIPPAQYQALIDLYNSTDGPHWKNKTGWLDPAAPTWFGVTVSGVQYDSGGNVVAPGFVQKLAMGNNSLSGPLPASLGNLTGLVSVSLSLNYLNGVLPATLGNLTSLESLSLPANLLSGPLPSSLGNLSHLKTLDLYNNLVTGPIPASLGNLANLQSLDLSGNPLNGPIPSSLGNLTNLQYLTLRYADLEGAIPSSLGNLSNLSDLFLYENNLSGEVPSSIANLTNLRRLIFYANQLSGEIPSALGNMVNLQLLDLRGNQFTGSIPSSFINLTNVQGISLSYNRLTGDVPPLTMQTGGPGSVLQVDNNFLDVDSSASQTNIQSLESRGVRVFYRPQSTPTPAPTPPRARLLNLSTRAEVLDGDKAVIAGFIVAGIDRWKRIVVRGIGPSMPVNGALANPIIELHPSRGGVIATNDNWKIRDATGSSQQSEIEAMGLDPTSDLEATLPTTINAPHSASAAYGTTNYTALLRGRDGGTGIGLAEVYDPDRSPDSELVNLSTRGFVGTGDQLMIGGFIIGDGTEPLTILIRGIGPSLARSGLTGILEDPVLELRDNSGTLIGVNDDWQTTQAQQIRDAGLAPLDARESAVLAELAPGRYTALLRGKSDTTGVALLEIYNLAFPRTP